MGFVGVPHYNNRALGSTFAQNISVAGGAASVTTFDKRKEDAQAFVAQIRKSIGKYDLVYTRSAEGRAILLDARIKALANKQERTFTKKQVMSDLK